MELPQLSMWNKCCPNTLWRLILTYKHCSALCTSLIIWNISYTLTLQLLSEGRITAGKRQIRKPMTQLKDSSPDKTVASPEQVILRSSWTVTQAVMMLYLVIAFNPKSPFLCLALLFPVRSRPEEVHASSMFAEQRLWFWGSLVPLSRTISPDSVLFHCMKDQAFHHHLLLKVTAQSKWKINDGSSPYI